MKLSLLLEYIISLPKSLYVSLKLLPFKHAFRIPLLVRYNTKILSLDGSAFLSKYRTGVVRFGFGSVGIFDKRFERTILQINGNVYFEGNASFGHGCRIYIGKNGVLKVGNNFSNTSNLSICCEQDISIGNNVLVSWRTSIMDTDFHETVNLLTGKVSMSKGSISIEDNVWIGMGVTILKNSLIPKGCVLGAESLINKTFDNRNCLIAGNPAKIVKNDITRYI